MPSEQNNRRQLFHLTHADSKKYSLLKFQEIVLIHTKMKIFYTQKPNILLVMRGLSLPESPHNPAVTSTSTLKKIKIPLFPSLKL